MKKKSLAEKGKKKTPTKKLSKNAQKNKKGGMCRSRDDEPGGAGPIEPAGDG